MLNGCDERILFRPSYPAKLQHQRAYLLLILTNYEHFCFCIFITDQRLSLIDTGSVRIECFWGLLYFVELKF